MENILNTLKEVNSYMKSSSISGTVTYRHEVSHMVRCGRSQISLNVSETGEKFIFELQEGKRKISGTITADDTELKKLQDFVTDLYSRLEFMPEVAHLKPLGEIAQVEVKHVADKRFDEIDSSIMVNLYAECDKHFKNENVEISGAFSAGIYSYAVINTLVEEPISYQGSDYNVEAVLQLLDHDKKEIRVADVGETLEHYDQLSLINHLDKIYKLKTTTERTDVPAGEYDIVFYSDAFSDITNYMGYLTMSGEAYEYGMGMLNKDEHKVGSKIFGDNVTIVDDPSDPEILFSRPIGRNGVERKNFPLITDGVIANMFYSDKDTCDRFSVEVNNDQSVAAIKLQAGDGPEDFDSMVKSCRKKTLFIPFIHYMNFTNPAKGEFTGTSRFGTFLIEGGEIKSHLYNLRINDSYHNIFNQIEWLSKKIAHVNTSDTYGMRSASSIACPQFVKVNNVKITGSSAPNRG